MGMTTGYYGGPNSPGYGVSDPRDMRAQLDGGMTLIQESSLRSESMERDSLGVVWNDYSNAIVPNGTSVPSNWTFLGTTGGLSSYSTPAWSTASVGALPAGFGMARVESRFGFMVLAPLPLTC